MNNRLKEYLETEIARFGGSSLVQRSSGGYELLNATPEERQEAREWASLFLHEAVLPECTRRWRRKSSRATRG